MNELLSPSRSYSEEDEKSVEMSELARKNINNTVFKVNSTQKVIIYVLTSLVIVLSGALVYQSDKSLMVPYVVEVDDIGHVRAVDIAKQSNYDVQEKEKQYFIERFILDARTIPLDPVLAKKQLTAAAALTTSTTRNKLSEDLRKENITGRIGVETTQLQMISNVVQTKDTYQVRWSEEVYNNDGTVKDRYFMVGSFTVGLDKVKNEAEWRLNPLGIFIKNFSWTRELR